MGIGSAWADIYQSVAPDGSVLFTNAPLTRKDRVVIKEQRRQHKDAVAPTEQAKRGSLAQQVATDRPGESVKSEKAVHVNYSKHAYADIVEEKAKKHNVDPKLVKSVIRAESNWNPKAVSPKGAMGLMQLMPSTAQLMGVSNPYDPEQNVDGGVKYLRHLLTRFDGNLTLALAAYNAGPKRVEQKGGVPAIPETVSYVQRIIGDYSGVRPMVDIPFSSGAKASTLIRRAVLPDGSIVYTNLRSYSARSVSIQ